MCFFSLFEHLSALLRVISYQTLSLQQLWQFRFNISIFLQSKRFCSFDVFDAIKMILPYFWRMPDSKSWLRTVSRSLLRNNPLQNDANPAYHLVRIYFTIKTCSLHYPLLIRYYGSNMITFTNFYLTYNRWQL